MFCSCCWPLNLYSNRVQFFRFKHPAACAENQKKPHSKRVKSRVCDTFQTFQGLPHLETFWIGDLLICAVAAVPTVVAVTHPVRAIPKSKKDTKRIWGLAKKNCPTGTKFPENEKLDSSFGLSAKRCNLPHPKIRGCRGSLSVQSTCPYGEI